MRQFFAQNLAFVVLFASIIAWLPTSASAIGNVIEEAAQIAVTHCQLWQRQLHHYPPAISLEDYRQMLGRRIAPEDAENLYASTLGIADFTFLLGNWRAVATRIQRQEFNILLYGILEPYWKTAPQPESPSCLPEVTLTRRPVPKDAELPAPRLFNADIQTHLLGIPLTYVLEQELSGWDIVDIRLGVLSLQAEYRSRIAAHLKNGRFEDLPAAFNPKN